MQEKRGVLLEHADQAQMGRVIESECDNQHQDVQQEAQDNADGGENEAKQPNGEQAAVAEGVNKVPLVPKVVYQEDAENIEDVGQAIRKRKREAQERTQPRDRRERGLGTFGSCQGECAQQRSGQLSGSRASWNRSADRGV